MVNKEKYIKIFTDSLEIKKTEFKEDIKYNEIPERNINIFLLIIPNKFNIPVLKL